ncbi:hypothetical protein [Calothrix sp. UHCC 0171]|uniref:hypothetical protein n=1 Tax=Calothrix sp. UHCC 0171 TaxID=3110245 RepID=UPI002B213A89|nr:hypothetical protein [Calothrix sp. UHCC 0171]MEA5573450.1 hypothetical protein [Calothrix sp. UHCC 0171]
MVATTIYPTTYTKLDNLVDATASILEQAFAIASQKQELSHQEYKNLLSTIGWSLRESKIYLKVATAFSNFAANDLKEVEPHTIFELAKHAKKYSQVIESLKNCSHITQEKVRELISAHRTPTQPKPDKPTIWKTGKDGEPVCRIPDIMEEDMQTGGIIQQEMDANGTFPQTLIREAIALWNDVKQGRLVVVGNQVSKEDVNKSSEQDNTDGDNAQNICESNTLIAANSTSERLDILGNHHNAMPTICTDYNQRLNGSQTENLAKTDAITEEANYPQPLISDITAISDLPTTNGLINLENQNTLPSSEQEKIKQYLNIDGDEIKKIALKIDDMVIWKKCPPQYQCWQPFQIQRIEGNMVKLDLLSYLIPIDELTKLPEEDGKNR